jgi:hypothetical protein
MPLDSKKTPPKMILGGGKPFGFFLYGGKDTYLLRIKQIFFKKNAYFCCKHYLFK